MGRKIINVLWSQPFPDLLFLSQENSSFVSSEPGFGIQNGGRDRQLDRGGQRLRLERTRLFVRKKAEMEGRRGGRAR